MVYVCNNTKISNVFLSIIHISSIFETKGTGLFCFISLFCLLLLSQHFKPIMKQKDLSLLFHFFHFNIQMLKPQ